MPQGTCVLFSTIRYTITSISHLLPPPARKTIDLEGRVVKDGVRTALRDRQDALSELVEATRKYWKLSEKTPLTLQGANFAQAVEELNKAIDRAEGLLQSCNDLVRRSTKGEST
jgi:hypothetical protein